MLPGHHLIPAQLHEGDGIEQPRMQAVICRIGHTNQKRDVQTPEGQSISERVEGLPLLLQVCGAEQQIPGWVTPEREFRRHHQLRFGSGGLDQAVEGVQDAVGIAQQVAHNRIHLGQGNTHRHSGIEGIEAIEIVLQQQRPETFGHLLTFLPLFQLRTGRSGNAKGQHPR